MAIIPAPPLSLKDAIGRQADIYDAWIGAWGTRLIPVAPFLGDDSYPDFRDPPIPDSVAGIAIGPESDVDKAWLTTNPSKNIAETSNPDLVIREVSVEQPLFFTQPAKIAPSLSTSPQFGISASDTLAQSLGDFYVVANVGRTVASGFRVTSTQVPPTYLKADFSVADLNPPFPGVNLRFAPPQLHLRLLLRSGIFVPSKRSPALWGNGQNDTIGLVADVEATIAQWPIYGRKTIGIHMRADLAGGVNDSVTFRVATLRTLRYTSVVQEETVGLKTIQCDAMGRAATGFHLCAPNAAYLILYATGTANGQMTGWNATMED